MLLSAKQEAAHKLLAQVVDVDLLHARGLGLAPRGLELLALAEVGGEGDDLAAVGVLQPLEDDRGVEAAGVGEDDLLDGAVRARGGGGAGGGGGGGGGARRARPRGRSREAGAHEGAALGGDDCGREAEGREAGAKAAAAGARGFALGRDLPASCIARHWGRLEV
jgi:hypothetical protein